MYRVQIMPALEVSRGSFTSPEVTTLASAMAIQIAVAETLLSLGDTGAMADYSNVITIETLVDGEWEEIDEDF